MAPIDIRSRSVHAGVGMVIALAVGLTFAFRSLLSFAAPDFWNAHTLLDYLAVVSWSVALATLAAGGWLVANLVAGRRAVNAGAVVLVLGSLVAAVGNLIEDGFGVKALGQIYAYGLGGVLVGLLWLAAALVLARRWWLAALPLVTFIGLFSSEFGGGLLILAGWAILAIVLRRSESLSPGDA